MTFDNVSVLNTPFACNVFSKRFCYLIEPIQKEFNSEFLVCFQWGIWKRKKKNQTPLFLRLSRESQFQKNAGNDTDKKIFFNYCTLLRNYLLDCVIRNKHSNT